METNFLSGTENLYKYLVSVGMLLVVIALLYPLKEKQTIEIESIYLERDLAVLNHNIKENHTKVELIKKNKINADVIVSIEKLNSENQISQIKAENKLIEITERRKQVALYMTIFSVFLPFGMYLIGFGFYKWYCSKKTDDEILNLEKEIKILEIKRLKNELKKSV